MRIIGWYQYVKQLSWLKVKWILLRYIAGETPVVINMEMKSYPVFSYTGGHGALISNVHITGFDGANRCAIQMRAGYDG